MAHVQNHTKEATGHLLSHYDRSGNSIGNENINPEKTSLNYNLAPHRIVNQGDFIRKRCSEVKCLNRKDVNIMCSWVVTAPKELKSEHYKKFFEETYMFLYSRYGGEQNVVSAYVHMDEITPHIHFAFVPVVRDKKKNIDKVSAFECVDRTDLRSFHYDLEKFMEKSFGYEIGILNDATKNGNRTIAELKKANIAQEIEIAQRALSEESSKVSALSLNIKSLKRTKRELQNKIENLESAFNVIYDIPKGKPNITGTKVVFTPKEANDLVKTSELYWLKNSSLKTALEELNSAKRRILELNQSTSLQNVQHLESENIKLNIENNRLKYTIETLEKKNQIIYKKISLSLENIPDEYVKIFTENWDKQNETQQKINNLELEL